MPSSHLILFRPLLLLPPIPPSVRVFPMSQLFTWGGQSIGVSASESVLPMNTQDWSLLGWTGWIPLNNPMQNKKLKKKRKNPGSGEEQGMYTSMVMSRAISGWCYTQCWFSDPKGARACISTSETPTPRRPASYSNCNMEGYLLPRTALESLLVGLSLYAHIRCLSVAPCYGWARPRLLSPQGPWAR